ncbi:chord-domain-containing protein [Chytriomyces cf. hyalinus JEL632]|nr:chord-domain-containing protein [Chytriomyces cf. hyalinus JEL632]
MTATVSEQLCSNKGCGKRFNPSDNGNTSCEHHPGAPVFHDALKGWSCCSKRVIEFDEFMKIGGCAVGPHVASSGEAKAEPEKKDKPAPTAVVDGKEVYGAVPAAPAKVNAAVASSAPATPTVAVVREEDLADKDGAVISTGTICKRKACGYAFQGTDACRSGECVFHSGSPVFHEGSKGWSCCSRKVLEFDEFLKIQGCKTGKHRFTDPEVHHFNLIYTARAQKNLTSLQLLIKADIEQNVECRRDWYQTPTTVIVSIFAKKVDKAATTVQFSEDKVSINAKFQDGKKYVETIPLALAVDAANCKFLVLSTKIELVLKKANGLSWPTLEMPADGVVLKSFTTFGVRDGSGQDAPLHLLK